MRKLVAGNWKMNGLRSEATSLVHGTLAGLQDGPPPCDLLVCPPATVLAEVAQMLAGSPVMAGGQTCHDERYGAHTGEVSAPMLRDAGASWVILGHSERRAEVGETDAMVAGRVRAAVAAGLTPIVCVGETETEHASGQAQEVVARQLVGSLPLRFTGVVAYEPVWAIGTGRTPTEADVAAMHALIRQQLVAHLGHGGQGLRVLYGGSVKPGNAASLMALPEVGGALVGGASLSAADFLAIARTAHPVPSEPALSNPPREG